MNEAVLITHIESFVYIDIHLFTVDAYVVNAIDRCGMVEEVHGEVLQYCLTGGGASRLGDVHQIEFEVEVVLTGHWRGSCSKTKRMTVRRKVTT